MKVQLFELMEDLVLLRKKVSINLSKANTNFACVYIIMLITVICLLNRKKIFKFKVDNKNVNFPTQFSLWSISNGFSDAELREASLNENICDVYDVYHLITVLFINLTY